MLTADYQSISQHWCWGHSLYCSLIQNNSQVECSVVSQNASHIASVSTLPLNWTSLWVWLWLKILVHGWENLSPHWWIEARLVILYLLVPYIQLLPLRVLQFFVIVMPKILHHLPSGKICPDVEWQSSLFLPQSESEYPINPVSELPSYLVFSSSVPLRYLEHILHIWCVPPLGYCWIMII